jgi:hypothetical protein
MTIHILILKQATQKINNLGQTKQQTCFFTMIHPKYIPAHY